MDKSGSAPALSSSAPERADSGWFPGWDGRPLHYRSWSGGSSPRGVVVLVHGIGGHSGLFENLAASLAPLGFDLHALDLPGHGRSPGPRGWIPSWAAFRDSLGLFLDHLQRQGRILSPPVLLGHSLGGTVVLDLALCHPHRARGLIVSNPALAANGVAPWRVLVARSLSGLWPTFSLATGIPLSSCSRDPEVLDHLAADPLCHSSCTARLATEFLTTAEGILRQAARLRAPLLVLQSGADTVTFPAEARRFFDAAGSADKTWRLYPASYHEIFADLDREQVIRDLSEWLAGHGG